MLSFKSPPLQRVPITLSEHRGVRYLHMGPLCIQGAMSIREPLKIELDYVQRMMASLLWLPSENLGAGSALQLGLGAGAITRFTAQMLHMPTTAIEIDREVVAINARWFNLPPDVTVVRDDANHWLTKAPPESFRLLHVDLYDHISAAPVHDSEEFYRACYAVLDQKGVMSVNVFGPQADILRSVRRIASAFGEERVWRTLPTREGNVAVIAGRSENVFDRELFMARAHVVEERFGHLGLRARKWLRTMRKAES
jgi:spermidine synthase